MAGPADRVPADRLTEEPCLVCAQARFASGINYVDRRAVRVPDGRVHLGCLGAWLKEWALEQWFPRADARERDVIRLRLQLDRPEPGELRDLTDVGRAIERTKERASQVQIGAMARFEEAVDHGVVVVRGSVARRLEEEATRRGQAPGELVQEALATYLGPARRTLSFAGLGDGQPGFRAADAKAVLDEEFGA